MTPTEACRVLGVEPDIAPKHLRRAYLRKVKGCKPDQDPEGFARLREAYELLVRNARFFTGGDWMRVDLDPAQGEDDGPWEQPPVPRAGETADQEPSSEPVLLPDPVDQDLIRVVLARWGERLEPAQHAILAQPPSPGRYLAVAQRLRRVGEPVAAALLLERALALDPSGPVLEPLVVDEALELLLDLQRALALEEGARLLAALQAALVRSGSELAWMKDARAVRWAMVRDLAALPDGFPGALRAALAWGVQAEDFTAAGREFLRLQRASADGAAEARALLEARAPQLSLLLRPIYEALDRRLTQRVSPSRAAPRPSEESDIPWGRVVWMVMLVALALGRLAGSDSCHSGSGERHPGPYLSSPYTPSVPDLSVTPLEPEPLSADMIVNVQGMFSAACEGDAPRLSAEACAEASSAFNAMLGGRCAEAQVEITTLQEWGLRADPLTLVLHHTMLVRCGLTSEKR